LKKHPLHRLMNPASLATVGANNHPMKMGTIQALSIIKDGFPGKFYPVHPSEETVLGYKAYPSVFDLPEPPDLAMLVVPPDQVNPLMEAFGQIGTRSAIIISAGFKETGEEGREREKELREISRRYGLHFLGPNCMGIINTDLPLNVTVAPIPQHSGKLGMASQSGTYVTQTLAYLRERGISFSKAISVGNEADLDITDALEFLGEDEQTRAVALYLEGIRDGKRFLEVARRITPYKPVVAQYVGGTEAGAKAGRSHTGAMSGPDKLMDGLFKQAGILRVHSVEDLYGYGWTLATQPTPGGKRVAVVTNSGGPGTAMAHTCNENGMEIPTFSSQLQEEIRRHLPNQGASGNPVDLTFHLDTGVLTTVIPKAIMESGEVDGMVLHGAMGDGFRREIYTHLKDLVGEIGLEDFLDYFQDDIDSMVSLPQKYGIPLVVSSFFGREDNYTAAYQDHHIPVFPSPEKAARAMVYLWKYHQVKERFITDDVSPPLPEKSGEAAKIIDEARKKGEAAVDEYRAKRILAAYGVPVCLEELVYSEAKAREAAHRLGYPVVLKGIPDGVSHKTEQGLVHLKLRNGQEVSRAFRAIQEAVIQVKAAEESANPGDVDGGDTETANKTANKTADKTGETNCSRAGIEKPEGRDEAPVLVSSMVMGEREFMAGMTRFDAFGPVLLFGPGGIFTEAFQDHTMRVPPLNRQEAGEMLFDTSARDLLDQYRGMPAANLDALIALVQQLGALSLLHPEIKEIDLNPIILESADSSRYAEPVVVDAFLVLDTSP